MLGLCFAFGDANFCECLVFVSWMLSFCKVMVVIIIVSDASLISFTAVRKSSVEIKQGWIYSSLGLHPMSCVRFYVVRGLLIFQSHHNSLRIWFLICSWNFSFLVRIWIVKGAVMCSFERDILKRKLAIPEWNFYLEQHEDLIQNKCR